MFESTRANRTAIGAILAAACFLTTAFVTGSASAAVYYTGSVVTTDEWGYVNDVFFWGDRVYANVELNYMGTPCDDYAYVSLVDHADGSLIDIYSARTNNPGIGMSYGYLTGQSLDAYPGFFDQVTTCDVVVTADEEIARASIVVLREGLFFNPEPWMLYPGEDVSIFMNTPRMTTVFYVQIVDEDEVTLVNWTTQVAPNGQWHTSWFIPEDFPDGEFRLRVRDASTHAIWYTEYLSVQKYALILGQDATDVLPGDTVEIAYSVIDIATLSPYTGVVVSYSAHWLDSVGGNVWEEGVLAGSDGVHTFSVPSDLALYNDIEIAYWANETSGIRSSQSWIWLYPNILNGEIRITEPYYRPSEQVMVQVEATVGDSALAGARVDISVESNGITVPVYGATGLVTDSDGLANHEFTLDSGASPGAYIVTATISKAGHSVTRVASFEVNWNANLIVTLDKYQYYCGDTVEMQFRSIFNGQEIQDVPVMYMIVCGSSELARGTTTTGSASYTLPFSDYGEMYVRSIANIGGYLLDSYDNFMVSLADVVVVPDSPQYAALDEIRFDYEILTSLASVELEYTIEDDYSIVVQSGSLSYSTNGTIVYTVPLNPSSSYSCRILLSSSSGPIAEGTGTAYLAFDFKLELTIGNSTHESGEFMPGEAVTVGYSIIPRGLPELPLYKLSLLTMWDDSSQVILTSEAQGTLQLQVSADAPNGWAWIDASLYDGVSNDWLASDGAAILINENTDVMDDTVGDLQNLTDELSSELSETMNEMLLMMQNMSEVQTQLDDARSALDETLEQLADMEENMTALEDSLEEANGRISERPTTGTLALIVVAAILVAAIIAAAVPMMMRKKQG